MTDAFLPCRKQPRGRGEDEIRRVVLLRRGRVFLDGRKEDVLSNEAMAALFEMPVEIVQRHGYYHLIS